ncbi:MAG TPA: hypothetical protein PKK43_12565 [Spirochaetota bacterium]|nr:hypothetical protein [Spirochaetota bacterium]
MKKITPVLITALFICTGCFDVMHYVEFRKDKSIYVDYRLTIGVGAKDAGAEIKQADDSRIFSGFGAGIKKYNPEIRRIENDRETGIELICTAPEKALMLPAEDSEYPLIPYKDAKGQYIFISQPKSAAADSNQDANKMIQSMFASSRYRIITGGTFTVKKAVIITNDQETATRFEPSIYKLGPLSFVDMPLISVMFKESAVIISESDTIDEKEIRAYFAKRNKEREEAAKKETENKESPPVDDENKSSNTAGER